MAALMEILVDADANVLDMGQAVIHDELALGILVQVPELGTLTHDITAQCHKVGSALRILNRERARMRPTGNRVPTVVMLLMVGVLRVTMRGVA